MRGFALAVLFLAAPASAMTPEDCRRIQDMVAGFVPAVNELRLSPAVTDDDWCRVIDGPAGGGWEWKFDQVGDGFTFDVRQRRFALDELGPFEVTGQVKSLDGGQVRVGPVRLREISGDSLLFSAVLGTESGQSGPVRLADAALTVDSSSGLVNDILAWAFRQDLQAARSSFISARDQRAFMQDWLETTAAEMTDDASVEAFEAILTAYPRSRGTAILSMRRDQPVDVAGLAMAVIRGAPFGRSEATELLREAGLTLVWQPD